MAAPTPNLILRWTDLITIPLKKHPVARDVSTGAVNLHKGCLEAGAVEPKLGNASQCKTCGKILDKSEIIKGFPENGRWLPVTEEELKALAAESTKEVEVVGFFPLAQMDLRWVAKADYLGPLGRPAEKAYHLLTDRLREGKLGALVKYTGYGRDKIGIIRAGAESLMLHDAYFPAEQRTYAEQFKEPLIPMEFSPEEKKLGDQLIASKVIDFNVAILEQADQYLDRVETLKETRRNGLPLPQFEKAPAVAAGGDLLAALKASLDLRPGRSFEIEPKPPVKMEAEKPKAKTSKKRSA